MILAGQLIAKVAELTGMPEASVVVVDRALLENGLRTKGTRGAGANMTARDAASLLLSCHLAETLTGAAKSLMRLGSATSDLPWATDFEHGDDFPNELAPLLDLGDEPMFLSTIAALIAQAPKLTALRGVGDYPPTILVKMTKPHVAYSIHIQHWGYDQIRYFTVNDSISIMLGENEWTGRFTEKTIYRLGMFLIGQDWQPPAIKFPADPTDPFQQFHARADHE